jgi:tetratricopeptide (TPR) repeat protein
LVKIDARISISANDLKGGDALAAEGRLDEALAAYHRYLAIWQTKRAKGSSIRAADQIEVALRRIGGLAPKFLMTGNFEQARTCAEEALAQHPHSVVLNVNLAHALMFLGYVEQAQAIYLGYRGKKMPPRGKSCDAFILQTFAQLRQVGLSHPSMDEIEQWFVETKEEANQQLGGPVEPPSEAVEPAINNDHTEVIAARLPDVEMGDKLKAERKPEEALVSYRRGLVICKVRIAEDATDSQAQDDVDLVVNRIGSLAFDFLLTRNTKQALKTIEEALRYQPDWLRLHLMHAHTLMFCACISGALSVHRKYCGRRLESGETWGAAIRADFAALQKAGLRHSFMAEIIRQFAAKA